MRSELKCFVEELIRCFINREEIYHVYYDGETEPKLVSKEPSFDILSTETSEVLTDWLTNYIKRREVVNYYEMYQHLVNEFCDLWVNPTLEELSHWNKKMNLFPSTNLTNTQSFQTDWEEAIHQNLLEEFEEEGYQVVSGHELIEHLVRSYDQNASKNISIIDWVKPTDISLLKNNQSYLIDQEIATKPILLTMQHIMERDNQNFSIAPCNLSMYFEHLQVTKRGLDSVEFVEDRQVLFYYYDDIEDYLIHIDYEQEERVIQKLTPHQVDPMKPFVEAVISDYSEIYINLDKINTEKDLLDFVNAGYSLEEIDLEAKSFNRKKIIEGLLCKSANRNRNIIIKRRDSIH